MNQVAEHTSGQQQKRGSLFSAIGALVGIGAFLLLPYFNITASLAQNASGYNQGVPAYSQTIAVGTGFVTLFSGLIWIEGLLAIAVSVLAALVLWRDAPFGNSATPASAQIRRAGYAILFLGIAGIAFQFLFVSIVNGQVNELIQSASLNGPSGSSLLSIGSLLARSGASLSVTIGYGFGSWLYLLGMIVASVGGAMLLQVGRVTSQMPVQAQGWSQPNIYQPQGSQQLNQYSSQPLSQYQPQSAPQLNQYTPQPPSQYPQQTWQPSSTEVQRPSSPQNWQGWQQPPTQR